MIDVIKRFEPFWRVFNSVFFLQSNQFCGLQEGRYMQKHVSSSQAIVLSQMHHSESSKPSANTATRAESYELISIMD